MSTEEDDAREVIREVAERAEAGDLFCVRVLGAIAFLLMPDDPDGGDEEYEPGEHNVIDLFLRKAA